MNRTAPLGDVRPLEMSEEEFQRWLPTIKRGIGGSAVAALLGISRFATPRDVWRDIFGVAAARVTTYPMERGIYLEPVAKAWFERTRKRKFVAYPGGFFRHPDPRFSFLVGHPDGILDSPAGEQRGNGIWECKVPLMDGYADALEVGVSGENVVQVQHYMEIAELAWGQFCIFDPGRWDAVTPELEYNREVVEEIKHVSYEFWHRHIVTREEPDDLTAIVRRVVIPTVGDVATILREAEHLRVLDHYIEAHRTYSQSKKLMEAAAEKMRTLMEELATDFVVDRTGKKVYYREVRADVIDVTALKERFPEIAAQVEKVQVTRPLKAYYPNTGVTMLGGARVLRPRGQHRPGPEPVQ